MILSRTRLAIFRCRVIFNVCEMERRHDCRDLDILRRRRRRDDVNAGTEPASDALKFARPWLSPINSRTTRIAR